MNSIISRFWPTLPSIEGIGQANSLISARLRLFAFVAAALPLLWTLASYVMNGDMLQGGLAVLGAGWGAIAKVEIFLVDHQVNLAVVFALSVLHLIVSLRSIAYGSALASKDSLTDEDLVTVVSMWKSHQNRSRAIVVTVVAFVGLSTLAGLWKVAAGVSPDPAQAMLAVLGFAALAVLALTPLSLVFVPSAFVEQVRALRTPEAHVEVPVYFDINCWDANDFGAALFELFPVLAYSAARKSNKLPQLAERLGVSLD